MLPSAGGRGAVEGVAAGAGAGVSAEAGFGLGVAGDIGGAIVGETVIGVGMGGAAGASAGVAGADGEAPGAGITIDGANGGAGISPGLSIPVGEGDGGTAFALGPEASKKGGSDGLGVSIFAGAGVEPEAGGFVPEPLAEEGDGAGVPPGPARAGTGDVPRAGGVAAGLGGGSGPKGIIWLAPVGVMGDAGDAGVGDSFRLRGRIRGRSWACRFRRRCWFAFLLSIPLAG